MGCDLGRKAQYAVDGCFADNDPGKSIATYFNRAGP